MANINFKMIYERVVLARKSRIKNILPYENFIDKINAAAGLLDYLEEKEAVKEIQQEARKYYVITCISSMENYFKRTAQIFIEARWINDDFLSILNEHNISLADLFKMGKEELKLSEIFMVSHSFQHLETIKHVFSKMLGSKDFLKEIEMFDVKYDDGTHIILLQNFPDYRDKVTELINLRHLIVHHEGYKGILGREKLYDLSRNLIGFIDATDEYINYKIPDK